MTSTRIVRVTGRDLAVEDPGPESGFPVMVHNGAGSRHLPPPAVAEARHRGFRLIGYDRPGCGGSTAMPGRVIADCATDVRAIMTEFGITRAASWGSSGGGPYALATAAGLPGAVTAVCLFASIGPYGMPDLDPIGGWGTGETGRSRMLCTAGTGLSLPVTGTSCAPTAAGSSTTTDRGRTTSPSTAPWGFDLADIHAPVSLWHGLQDFVPVAHARWLADRIPSVTTHFPPDDDHTNIEENNRSAAFEWLTGRI